MKLRAPQEALLLSFCKFSKKLMLQNLLRMPISNEIPANDHQSIF